MDRKDYREMPVEWHRIIERPNKIKCENCEKEIEARDAYAGIVDHDVFYICTDCYEKSGERPLALAMGSVKRK